MPLWIIILTLGIVEGLTEFIPVSSTGHLILTDHLIGFQQILQSKEKADLFTVFIQLGAILAIALIYREKLWGVATKGLFNPGRDRRLLIALILGFFPAAVVGLAANKLIKHYLFSPVTVAWALVVGGIIMMIIERLPLKTTAHSTEEMSYRQAFAVGIAQIFSLFPGTSRSGATIMGGLCAGLDRKTATEFSFLLSFPVMLAASGLDLFQGRELLDVQMLGVLAGGFLTAFISAWIVVKWLIAFVQRHDFTIFAIYRIVFGMILLYFFKIAA